MQQAPAHPDAGAKVATVDPVALGYWYAVVAIDELAGDSVMRAQLLGQRIHLHRDANGRFSASSDTVTNSRGVNNPHCCARYGYVWVSLADNPAPLFDIPEFNEADRRNVNAASVGVHTSGPRIVENFLDMGHFPFVHAGILGAEPHTEVTDYQVDISADNREILATRCRFFQPMAAAASGDGAVVDYVYRVPHPFAAILYKSSPTDPARRDVIAIFLQPMTETRTRVHMLLSILDTTNDNATLRRFQQMIFSQDKPILENQFPKRLPLDPHAEVAVRADLSAITYRRWLDTIGLRYGVIPITAADGAHT